MMYGYGYGMGVWMIIGWVIMAAVIVLAVYGLILLLRKTDTGTMSYKPVDSLSILKERLAKGEIDTEEYRKIKEELQN